MTEATVAAIAIFVVYGAFLLLLVVLGKRQQATAWARFIPDCVLLFKRLLSDKRVPRSRKVLVAFLLFYLSMPFDLVPDFIPVAGQLDDAILVALVLRSILGGTGPDVVRELWPGPRYSANMVLKMAGVAATSPRSRAHATAINRTGVSGVAGAREDW